MAEAEYESKPLSVADLEGSDNIAELLPEADLQKIGMDVVDGYLADDQSRAEWCKRMENANDLAMQMVKDKNFPWDNAANVKFPLLTIAAMQFAARAYPALVKAPDLVKYRVQGEDPDGSKAARASRISAHMSYQLLEEDELWEEQQDKAFFALPIVGSIFKKSYRDGVKGYNCSDLVLPKDLVVNYYTKSLDECERVTHRFTLSGRLIKERQLRKLYRDVDLLEPQPGQKTESDARQGIDPPALGPHPRIILEQHAFWDLDQDGYAEPYVVTVDKESRKVLRIVHAFERVISEQSVEIEENEKRMREIAENIPQPGSPEAQQVDPRIIQNALQTVEAMAAKNEKLAAEKPKVLRIEPIQYFTKYSFIPSPDGGFYDLGFGALLSPIGESVNTIINQLIDAGTLQNNNSGFLGRGARIEGGRLRFSPGEWKRVNVPGAQLRDAIVPLPVNQPSSVLFQLLGMLINYAERITSVTEAMSGQNPGQNTPAYNMSAMLEQGLQVFNGIFKRIYRSFRSELRKMYKLNALYLDGWRYFDYLDSNQAVHRRDYQADPKDLIPAADPNAFANKEKQAKAQMIAERAQMVPGYDTIKIEQWLLEAMEVPNAAELFPVVQNQETGAMELKFPPPPNPELELKGQEEARRTQEAKDRYEINLIKALSDEGLKEAQVIEILARAEEHADKPELERLKIIHDDIKDQRAKLMEMAKAEQDEQNSEGTSGGVD